MARENTISAALALLLVALFGVGVWFFILSRPEVGEQPQPLNSDISPPAQGEELPPPTEANLPEPPQGHAVLIDKNPDMPAKRKNELASMFTEVVAKIKLDPGNAVFWNDLGSIKYSFNDFAGAEAAWKYAVKLNPLADNALLNLSALYQYKAPNYPEAERALRAAIEIRSPARLMAYSELFDLYRYRYKEKEHLAEGLMLEAYREFPEQHAILKTIAWYFLEKDNKQKAIEYFGKFLAKVPNDASANEELERLKQQ